MNAEDTDKLTLYVTVIVANLGSFLFGFDFGAVSWLLISMTTLSSTADDGSYFDLVINSSSMVGFIACGSAIGAAFTYLLLLFFGNSLAKHHEIGLAAVFYFIGAMLESTSGLMNWQEWYGLMLLISGRLIYGSGVAATFHSVPQYVSELGPAELRGMVGSVTEAMIVTGTVIGYFVGYLYQSDQGWVVTFRVAYLVAFIMFACSLWIPQSPFWLAKNNSTKEEILNALRFIYPTASVETSEKLIDKSQKQERDNKKWENKLLLLITSEDSNNCCSCCSLFNQCFFKSLTTELAFLFYDKTLSRCLIFAIVFVVLQMSTGQAAILYFAGTIFDSLCPDDPDMCILGLGLTKLLAAYSMLFIGDLFGRRAFLIGGSSLLSIGNIVLIFGIYYSNSPTSLTGIYTSVVGYEISFGCMLWILLSEIFPQFVRSAANAISVFTLFTFMAIVTFSLPIIVTYFGLMDLFVLYTILSIISVMLFFLFAPETRGVDLEKSYLLVDSACNETFIACGCLSPDSKDLLVGEDEDYFLGSTQRENSYSGRKDPLQDSDVEINKSKSQSRTSRSLLTSTDPTESPLIPKPK